jgi:uncharacterized protein YrrD
MTTSNPSSEPAEAREPAVVADVASPADQVHMIDPNSYLRPQLRVKGERGKSLGTVIDVERDDTGTLMGITIRHGLLGRKRTRVAVNRIKQVNRDSVVVEYSANRFGKLPRME